MIAKVRKFVEEAMCKDGMMAKRAAMAAVPTWASPVKEHNI